MVSLIFYPAALLFLIDFTLGVFVRFRVVDTGPQRRRAAARSSTRPVAY